jgi:L-histidine Nalpha-methyltransferase
MKVRMDPKVIAERDATTQTFLEDATEGLRSRPKRIPCKYFYDERGSGLFEEICRQPEYYLTRTELAIMRDHAAEMAEQIGPRSSLIELGSGSSLKTRLLLGHLKAPASYVPVDISGETLRQSAQALRSEFLGLKVVPVHADFTRPLTLPPAALPERRRVVYIPGSTIGNFDSLEAASLLRGIARLAGPDGGLLIGVDLRKDPAVLHAAYNDRRGVTAAFNRNLLYRMRRELGAGIEPEQFAHRAFYNEAEGRIEMHLASRVRQTIRLEGAFFELVPGETIHTENSYKYDLDGFAALAGRAGFVRTALWLDSARLFSVQHFERRPEGGSGR